jgi:hypothetical protein
MLCHVAEQKTRSATLESVTAAGSAMRHFDEKSFFRSASASVSIDYKE